MFNNIILNTDSYKASMYLQSPPGTQYQNSYIESRGGKWSETLFFGLQAFIKEYLLKPITWEMIQEAETFWLNHGEPFNKDGWEYILREHKGYLPLYIEAVKEGTVVPTSNVLVQVVNTDPKCYWLTSYLETALMRAVWYPTTVATNSYMNKKAIYENLKDTSDDPKGQIGFKLHDFGSRGVSSMESAALGGAAHLINFLGTDTVAGVLAARKYYNERMAGFSIPAAEHSTITSWGGPDFEADAFNNMLDQFAKKGKMVAVVSDSYDIYNATKHIWGEALKDKVMNSGAVVVVRPDSGDPTTVPIKIIRELMNNYGSIANKKGYLVLPSCVRVIQGDGIKYDSLLTILANMKTARLSMDNLAFGMGGGLLQEVNRDTLQFAMKCSAVKINGVWKDVWKKPVGDPGKNSKKGRLGLFSSCGVGGCSYSTRRIDVGWDVTGNLLEPVFRDGVLLRDQDFSEIRTLSSEKF